MKNNQMLFLVLIGIFVITLGGIIIKSLVDEKPKVVVVTNEVGTDYWKLIKAGAEKGFRDFNIDGKVITVRDGSSKEMKTILENVYKENPDVLIIRPENSFDIKPALDKFVNNKIPVLLVSSNIDWGKEKSFIGTDDVLLGEKAGIFLGFLLQPSDKVAIISGDFKQYPTFVQRIKGFNHSLKTAGINVVEDAVVITDDYNDVEDSMTKILYDHPDLKGVIATHDKLTLHLVKFIEQQELDIQVIGASGSTSILELIEAERIQGSAVDNPYDMGYLSVETALKVTKGERVEKFVDTGVDIIVKDNAKDRREFLKNEMEKSGGIGYLNGLSHKLGIPAR